MSICNAFRIKGLLAGLALSIMFFLAVVAPQVSAAAEPVALTVTGNGVNHTVQFTMDELKALPQKTYTYSGYNHWPSLQVFKNLTGPTLKSILDVAGLKDNATSIRVKSASGAYSDFTKAQLLDEPRYYFPDGENPGDCVGWPVVRSEKGKVPVETILAFNMTGGKLVYGQRAPNEPTCCKNQMLEGLLPGVTIEVSTAPLERWEAPHADVAPGTVAPGTKVTLQHGDGTPYHAIVYYTLDGSEPTYGSNILNISYPSFQPEMNKPIPVNGKVTIKTRTIGLGKLDSEVVTFQYNTGAPAQASGVEENTAGKGEEANTPKDDRQAEETNNAAGEAKGTIQPVSVKHFADIESHWAKDDIYALVEKGIIAGVTDTEFRPEDEVTRAQFAKLLVNALNIKFDKGAALSFKDVPAGAWYHDVVAAAVKAGLVKGGDDGIFAPDENITREEMAVIISQALKMKSAAAITDFETEQIINKFTDKEDISALARQGIALAVRSGILSGADRNTFAPHRSVTRAEAASVILRLYKQLQ